MLTFLEFKSSPDAMRYLTKDSLGIPRNEMPQINGDLTPDFLKYLENLGITHKYTEIEVEKLKITQGEINVDLILPIIDNIQKNIYHLRKNKPIITSKDFYILDGHHRFAANFFVDGKRKIEVVIINVGIKKLIQLAKDFDKVSFKEIHESKI